MIGRCLAFALVIWGAAQSLSAAEMWQQHMDAGRKLEASGRIPQAKEEFQAALQATSASKDAKGFATRVELGTAAALMGEYVEAEQWDNEAVRVGLELYGKQAPENAAPFTNLAALYRDQGDYGRAEEFCRRALGLISEPAAALPAMRAQVLGTLGGILDRRGKLAEAEAALRQSAQIAETLPPPSLILAGDLSNLAGIYAKTGRADEALATYRQAYALNEKAGGPNDPSLFFILAGMASVEAGAGHYAKAVEAIESGIQKADAGGAGNTLQVRDALVAEAAWLHKLKREEEARQVRAREKQVAEAAARNSYLQYTVDARQIAQTLGKPQP